MGVRVTGIFAVLRGFNTEKKLQPLSKITYFYGGFRVGEAAERVAGISEVLYGFNVEKNLRNPLEVAAFCGRISETVNQAAILTGLNCCNVEKKLQTFSSGAVFGSGGFRGQEPAERVAGISAGLNCFNAEKKLQTLLKVTAAGGELVGEPISRVTVISVLLNSINVEKNPGMSEKVAVENSLGNDFYKRSVKKCRYE